MTKIINIMNFIDFYGRCTAFALTQKEDCENTHQGIYNISNHIFMIL